MILRKISLATIALFIISSAFASSNKSDDCNNYPETDVSDISVNGKIGINGLRKLAGGEAEGSFSTNEKKLLANLPDANKTRVLFALMAMNCRIIHSQGLTSEQKQTNDKFTDKVMKALYPSEKTPLPEKQKTSPNQEKESKPPSASLAIMRLSVAAEKYKLSLRSTYLAALDGKFVENIPYDFMLDKFMLRSAAQQNMMQSVPNVEVIPEDQTTSLSYDLCDGIKSANKIIEKTLTLYNSKIPESYYQDIKNIHSTRIYQHFAGKTDEADCKMFLGELKYQLAKKRNQKPEDGKMLVFEVPLSPPKFSEEELAEYIRSVRKFDEHTINFLKN